jgi:hypothetical protein
VKTALKNLTRRLSRWAWSEELDQKEGENFLKELYVKPGGMEAYIEFKPEVAQWIGKCLAYVVMKSPNYTEMQYQARGSETEFKGEWVGPITVTVRKELGQTPNQLRVEAEKQRDELISALEDLVGEADLGECDLEPEELAKLERARAALARVGGGR